MGGNGYSPGWRALALALAMAIATPWMHAATLHDPSESGIAEDDELGGQRTLPDEPALAETLEEVRALALGGDVRHQLYLGALHEYGEKGLKRDAGEAALWYAKAAEQGLARARTRLGMLYDDGRGVRADPQRAVELYRLAANRAIRWARPHLPSATKAAGAWSAAARSPLAGCAWPRTRDWPSPSACSA